MKSSNIVPCFDGQQIYTLEKQWFCHNQSFSLMQQASWQMANWLINQFQQPQNVLIAVGSGNNGGDGWLLGYYLAKLCPTWQILMVETATANTQDSQLAKQTCIDCSQQQQNLSMLSQVDFWQQINKFSYQFFRFNLIIDGLFGIGLSHQPSGDFKQMIDFINCYKQYYHHCQVISIDIPSGLNANTGEVYQNVAVQADITLCLIARKIGCHLKDGKDYVGTIIDFPLIPNLSLSAIAYFHQQLPTLTKRFQNLHKGNFGHLLIIGGNQLQYGQGMGGAAVLSASTAFVSGVGKVTVACHQHFHVAMVASLPNVMTFDIERKSALKELIQQVDGIVIGMGLGRDEKAYDLCLSYLSCGLQYQKKLLLDADALYHLPKIIQQNPKILSQIKATSCYFTPHVGEASHLLKLTTDEVEKDRISAIQNLQQKFGGNWLLKGANSLVVENGLHICGFGNVGMATAGMGDSLAGLLGGLMIQEKVKQPLLSAVLIHAKAGDNLAKIKGDYSLQANQIADSITDVIKTMTA